MWETGEKTASTIVRLFSVCYENDSRERKSGALFLARRERGERIFYRGKEIGCGIVWWGSI